MYLFLAFAVALVSTCNGNEAHTGDPNAICKRRNEYLAVNGSCDSYVECREYTATDMVCPDGLNFNPAAKFPDYPCGYPVDLPCEAGTESHPKRPTDDCPRQYGFFPSPKAEQGDCGVYHMCVEGHAYEMSCPPGLAFNSVNGRCDWPDQVPSCKVDEYFGFKCPKATTDDSGNAIVSNHKYDEDCYAFFSCQEGKARLLACDMGLAFDESSGICVDADKVSCKTRPL